jgi:hypothetical protein
MHRNLPQKQLVCAEVAEEEGRIVPLKRNLEDVAEPKKRAKASDGLDKTPVKSVQTPKSPKKKEERKMHVCGAVGTRTTPPVKQTGSKKKKSPQEEKTSSGSALDSSKPEDDDNDEENDERKYMVALLYTDNIAAACAATNERVLGWMPLTYEELQIEQQEKRLAVYKKRNRMMLADNTVIMDLTKRNLGLKRELDEAKRKAARVLGGLLPSHQSDALLSEIFTDTMDMSPMRTPDNLSSSLATMRHLHDQHQQQTMFNSSSSRNSSLLLQQLLTAFSSSPASDLKQSFSSSAGSSSGVSDPDGKMRSPQDGKGKQGSPCGG